MISTLASKIQHSIVLLLLVSISQDLLRAIILRQTKEVSE